MGMGKYLSNQISSQYLNNQNNLGDNTQIRSTDSFKLKPVEDPVVQNILKNPTSVLGLKKDYDY